MNQSLVLERFGNAVAVLPTIVALDGKQLQEAGRHIIGDGKLFGQLFGSAIEKGFSGVLMKFHHTIEKDRRLNLSGRRTIVLEMDAIEQLLYRLEPKSSAGQIVAPVSLLLRYGVRHARHIAPEIIFGNGTSTKDFMRLLSGLIERRQECSTSRGKSSLGGVNL